MEKIRRNFESKQELMQRTFDNVVEKLRLDTDQALENALEFRLFHKILTGAYADSYLTSTHSQSSISEIKIVQQDSHTVCQLLEAGSESNAIGRHLLGSRRYEQLIDCIGFLSECGVSVILRGNNASPIARAIWSDKKRVVAKCPYALNKDISNELIQDDVTNIVILNANLSPIDVYLEEFVYHYLNHIDDLDKKIQALITFSESPLALPGNSLLSSITVTIDLDINWNESIKNESYAADFGEAVDTPESMKAYLVRMYPELNSWSLNKMCDYLFDDTKVSADYKEAIEKTKRLIQPFISGSI